MRSYLIAVVRQQHNAYDGFAILAVYNAAHRNSTKVSLARDLLFKWPILLKP